MNIKFENQELNIENGLKIREGLKEQIEKSEKKDIIAAIYNNEVASLNHIIKKELFLSIYNNITFFLR